MIFQEPVTAQDVRDLAARMHPPPSSPIVVLPRKMRKQAKRDWLFVSTRPPKADPVSISARGQLLDQVLMASGTSKIDFMSRRRTKHIVQARHAYYWLCAEYTSLSYPQIGRFAGGRDHTTVMKAFASKTMYAPRTCKIINDVIDTLKLPVPECWQKQGATE